MSRKRRLVQVLLSDEELALVAQAAESRRRRVGTRVRLGAQGRLLLLQWARQALRFRGALRGGDCESCGQSGATYWNYATGSFWCSICAQGNSACSPEAPQDLVTEEDVRRLEAEITPVRTGRPARSHIEKLVKAIKHSVAIFEADEKRLQEDQDPEDEPLGLVSQNDSKSEPLGLVGQNDSKSEPLGLVGQNDSDSELCLVGQAEMTSLVGQNESESVPGSMDGSESVPSLVGQDDSESVPKTVPSEDTLPNWLAEARNRARSN